MGGNVEMHTVVCRICTEYIEMPGVRLTVRQVQRLWGLEEEACREALECLVDAKFLCRTTLETYVRFTEEAVGKADV